MQLTTILQASKQYGMHAGMLFCTANLKGGVGKTTLAVHLAVWLRQKGLSVAFVDADMQASSSQWIREAGPDISLVHLQDPDEILDQAPKLKEQYEVVIADGPAGMAELSRAILLHADLALVLCGPSTLDLRASATAVRVIKQAQVIRNGMPRALFIANKVQVHTHLSKELLASSAVMGIPMAQTAVKFRQVYADAPGQGETVFTMGYKAREAVQELNLLFEEVYDGKTPILK
jgi:chromosome partitioning protein